MKIVLILLISIIFSQAAFANMSKPPAPVFQSVSVSSEDEEFVKAKILENSPTIPVSKSSKEKNTVYKKKKTVKIKKVNETKKTVKIPTEETIKNEQKKEEVFVDDINVEEIEPEKELSFADMYDPVKENFFTIAGFILVFPVVLFLLMLKVINSAKKDFEIQEGLEETVEPITSKKVDMPPVKKSEILATREYYQKQKKLKQQEKQPLLTEKEPEEENDEFVIEDVFIEEKAEIIAEKVDAYEVEEGLKFYLSQKEDFVYLTCSIQGVEKGIIKIDGNQKLQKVRKIDTKGDKDIYMVKLDNWRGLVEVSVDNARYLMDI